MKKEVKLVIFLAIMILGFLIAILYLSWPLLTGKTIILQTQPVDPFDLFRGQYLVIRYDISSIPIISGVNENSLISQTIYVKLNKNDSSNVYNYGSAYLEKPNEGTFIKGKIKSISHGKILIEYGIEQYFFERNAEINTRGIQVEVKVDSSGQARISRLLKDEKPVEIKYS